MPPNLDEQIDIWRYAYARSALNEAKATIERLLSNQGLERVVRRGLLYALIVCYARPFTKWQVTPSKRIMPLGDAPPVPDHLKVTHYDYLELRDKVVGHKDATPGPGRSGHPNVVHLNVDLTGYNLHTTEFEISDSVLKELGELAEFFIDHCVAKLTLLMTKFGPDLKALGPGHYNLTPAEPPQSWIQRVRPLGSWPEPKREP